ncbi:hypothetical protein EYZ11_008670 [Aspergillus tanneri]|uniref:Uncharacterized protein n=1 Tax=Aspergillus tanneri TaxID=1220188 RepID=A0A4S3JA23_9EURO|nr:hypothetical protein EYZ11_008670 [Aspergillus tanneri]
MELKPDHSGEKEPAVPKVPKAGAVILDGYFNLRHVDIGNWCGMIPLNDLPGLPEGVESGTSISIYLGEPNHRVSHTETTDVETRPEYTGHHSHVLGARQKRKLESHQVTIS